MKGRELHRQARRVSSHRCDQCRSYGRWTVSYIDTVGVARTKVSCGMHVTRTLKSIAQQCLTDIRVVDNGDEG